jgi:hypothetical protein
MGLSTVGVSPADIWGYASRTLTQTKFPFWSAVILPNPAVVSVPANAGTATVTIRPPSGETWFIFLQASIVDDTTYTNLRLQGCVGTTCTDNIDVFQTGGLYSDTIPHIFDTVVISNNNYVRLFAVNQNTVLAKNLYYMYSGFKLSQPQWTPSRASSVKPVRLPTNLPLPDPIKPLDKYKALILGLDPRKPEDYVLGVVLEEDTPIAVDPNTGFPVERYSAYVPATALADLITKFKRKELDPVATGYKKYLEKWFREGIDLGVSF